MLISEISRTYRASFGEDAQLAKGVEATWYDALRQFDHETPDSSENRTILVTRDGELTTIINNRGMVIGHIFSLKDELPVVPEWMYVALIDC